MNTLMIIPIIVFIAVSLSLYSFSNDPDKKQKPKLINYILPALVLSVATFGFGYS